MKPLLRITFLGNLQMEMHICTYSGSKYRQIHADMHWMHECICACIPYKNTIRYIQIWTPPESAYLYVSARMWVEYIWHTDTYAQDTEHRKGWYRHIQPDTAMCICHMHSLYPICTWLFRVHMSVHICMYLFQIHTRYISSYPCCICMYFW